MLPHRSAVALREGIFIRFRLGTHLPSRVVRLRSGTSDQHGGGRCFESRAFRTGSSVVDRGIVGDRFCQPCPERISNDTAIFCGGCDIMGLLYTTLVYITVDSSYANKRACCILSLKQNTFSGDTVEISIVFIVLYAIITPIIYIVERRVSQNQEQEVSARRVQLTALRFALGMWTSTMVGIMVVELGKGYVGRLRPAFAQACLDPPPSMILSELQARYLEASACTTEDLEGLQDMRRSFPSGHATLAVGGAMYAQLYALYVLKRVHVSEVVNNLVYFIATVGMVLGYFVAASRVFDNAHHVGDIVAGSVVGLWSACVHFFYVVGATERAASRDGKEKTQ